MVMCTNSHTVCLSVDSTFCVKPKTAGKVYKMGLFEVHMTDINFQVNQYLGKINISGCPTSAA